MASSDTKTVKYTHENKLETVCYITPIGKNILPDTTNINTYNSSENGISVVYTPQSESLQQYDINDNEVYSSIWQYKKHDNGVGELLMNSHNIKDIVTDFDELNNRLNAETNTIIFPTTTYIKTCTAAEEKHSEFYPKVFVTIQPTNTKLQVEDGYTNLTFSLWCKNTNDEDIFTELYSICNNIKNNCSKNISEILIDLILYNDINTLCETYSITPEVKDKLKDYHAITYNNKTFLNYNKAKSTVNFSQENTAKPFNGVIYKEIPIILNYSQSLTDLVIKFSYLSYINDNENFIFKHIPVTYLIEGSIEPLNFAVSGTSIIGSCKIGLCQAKNANLNIQYTYDKLTFYTLEDIRDNEDNDAKYIKLPYKDENNIVYHKVYIYGDNSDNPFNPGVQFTSCIDTYNPSSSAKNQYFCENHVTGKIENYFNEICNNGPYIPQNEGDTCANEYIEYAKDENHYEYDKINPVSINWKNFTHFVIKGEVYCSGNIMSLVYQEIPNNGNVNYITEVAKFAYLFKDCAGLRSAPDLTPVLGSKACYYHMFDGCVNLLKTPLINLKYANDNNDYEHCNMPEACFEGMFYNCTLLTISDNTQLPSSILTARCFKDMFKQSGITSINKLFKWEHNKTILDSYCCMSMFENCTKLTSIPENLFGTIDDKIALTANSDRIANYAYYRMFKGCTSISAIPVNLLDNHFNLSPFCFANMFEGCTDLLSAPNLSYKKLSEGCYYGLFKDCVSLKRAPILPAEKLVKYCYVKMFNGCTNLRYINMTALSTPRNSEVSGTKDWVGDYNTNTYKVGGTTDQDVTNNTTGVFVKSFSATWDTVATFAIPKNWVVMYDPSTIGYVDLGLTSGTKWAKYNLGAKNEWDTGDFYRWGDTLPIDHTGDDMYQFNIEYDESGLPYIINVIRNDEKLRFDVSGNSIQQIDDSQMHEIITNSDGSQYYSYNYKAIDEVTLENNSCRTIEQICKKIPGENRKVPYQVSKLTTSTDGSDKTISDKTTLYKTYIYRNIQGMLNADPAAANWGGNWRIPTYRDFNELFTECDVEYDDINYDMPVFIFTGKNGNQLIIPWGSKIQYTKLYFKDITDTDFSDALQTTGFWKMYEGLVETDFTSTDSFHYWTATGCHDLYAACTAYFKNVTDSNNVKYEGNGNWTANSSDSSATNLPNNGKSLLFSCTYNAGFDEIGFKTEYDPYTQSYFQDRVQYTTEDYITIFPELANHNFPCLIRPIYKDVVDLGTSVLYSSTNVNATHESDPGERFAFGEITTKNIFTPENYTFINTNSTTPTKIDNLGTSTATSSNYWEENRTKVENYDNITSTDIQGSEYDVAFANSNGKNVMMSYTQMSYLLNYDNLHNTELHYKYNVVSWWWNYKHLKFEKIDGGNYSVPIKHDWVWCDNYNGSSGYKVYGVINNYAKPEEEQSFVSYTWLDIDLNEIEYYNGISTSYTFNQSTYNFMDNFIFLPYQNLPQYYISDDGKKVKTASKIYQENTPVFIEGINKDTKNIKDDTIYLCNYGLSTRTSIGNHLNDVSYTLAFPAYSYGNAYCWTTFMDYGKYVRGVRTRMNYIDLDLPSGNCWATHNLGAAEPTSIGNYYQWGSTNASKDGNSIQTDKYEFYDSKKSTDTIIYDDFSIVTDLQSALSDDYDTASRILGEDWSMPTVQDVKELITYTNQMLTYTVSDDNMIKYSIKFTSKTSDKSIYVPFGGWVEDGNIKGKFPIDYEKTSKTTAVKPIGKTDSDPNYSDTLKYSVFWTKTAVNDENTYSNAFVFKAEISDLSTNEIKFYTEDLGNHPANKLLYDYYSLCKNYGAPVRAINNSKARKVQANPLNFTLKPDVEENTVLEITLPCNSVLPTKLQYKLIWNNGYNETEWQDIDNPGELQLYDDVNEYSLFTQLDINEYYEEFINNIDNNSSEDETLSDEDKANIKSTAKKLIYDENNKLIPYTIHYVKLLKDITIQLRGNHKLVDDTDETAEYNNIMNINSENPSINIKKLNIQSTTVNILDITKFNTNSTYANTLSTINSFKHTTKQKYTYKYGIIKLDSISNPSIDNFSDGIYVLEDIDHTTNEYAGNIWFNYGNRLDFIFGDTDKYNSFYNKITVRNILNNNIFKWSDSNYCLTNNDDSNNNLITFTVPYQSSGLTCALVGDNNNGLNILLGITKEYITRQNEYSVTFQYNSTLTTDTLIFTGYDDKNRVQLIRHNYNIDENYVIVRNNNINLTFVLHKYYDYNDDWYWDLRDINNIGTTNDINNNYHFYNNGNDDLLINDYNDVSITDDGKLVFTHTNGKTVTITFDLSNFKKENGKYTENGNSTNKIEGYKVTGAKITPYNGDNAEQETIYIIDEYTYPELFYNYIKYSIAYPSLYTFKNIGIDNSDINNIKYYIGYFDNYKISDKHNNDIVTTNSTTVDTYISTLTDETINNIYTNNYIGDKYTEYTEEFKANLINNIQKYGILNIENINVTELVDNDNLVFTNDFSEGDNSYMYICKFNPVFKQIPNIIDSTTPCYCISQDITTYNVTSESGDTTTYNYNEFEYNSTYISSYLCVNNNYYDNYAKINSTYINLNEQNILAGINDIGNNTYNYNTDNILPALQLWTINFGYPYDGYYYDICEDAFINKKYNNTKYFNETYIVASTNYVKEEQNGARQNNKYKYAIATLNTSSTFNYQGVNTYTEPALFPAVSCIKMKYDQTSYLSSSYKLDGSLRNNYYGAYYVVDETNMFKNSNMLEIIGDYVEYETFKGFYHSFDSKRLITYESNYDISYEIMDSSDSNMPEHLDNCITIDDNLTSNIYINKPEIINSYNESITPSIIASDKNAVTAVTKETYLHIDTGKLEDINISDIDTVHMFTPDTTATVNVDGILSSLVDSKNPVTLNKGVTFKKMFYGCKGIDSTPSFNIKTVDDLNKTNIVYIPIKYYDITKRRYVIKEDDGINKQAPTEDDLYLNYLENNQFDVTDDGYRIILNYNEIINSKYYKLLNKYNDTINYKFENNVFAIVNRNYTSNISNVYYIDENDNNSICLYVNSESSTGYKYCLSTSDISIVNNNCGGLYESMFENCTNLTTIRNIRLTFIPNYGCCRMFKGCTNLTDVPLWLNTSSVGVFGMNAMFMNCTQLLDTMGINKSVTIQDYGLSFMYSGCTKLNNTNNILAYLNFSRIKYTKGINWRGIQFVNKYNEGEPYGACSYIFYNCVSLEDPSVLTSNNAPYCWLHTYHNCIDMLSYPELLSEQLSIGCYNFLFVNCINAINNNSEQHSSLVNLFISTATNSSKYMYSWLGFKSSEISDWAPTAEKNPIFQQALHIYKHVGSVLNYDTNEETCSGIPCIRIPNASNVDNSLIGMINNYNTSDDYCQLGILYGSGNNKDTSLGYFWNSPIPDDFKDITIINSKFKNPQFNSSKSKYLEYIEETIEENNSVFWINNCKSYNEKHNKMLFFGSNTCNTYYKLNTKVYGNFNVYKGLIANMENGLYNSVTAPYNTLHNSSLPHSQKYDPLYNKDDIFHQDACTNTLLALNGNTYMDDDIYLNTQDNNDLYSSNMLLSINDKLHLEHYLENRPSGVNGVIWNINKTFIYNYDTYKTHITSHDDFNKIYSFYNIYSDIDYNDDLTITPMLNNKNLQVSTPLQEFTPCIIDYTTSSVNLGEEFKIYHYSIYEDYKVNIEIEFTDDEILDNIYNDELNTKIVDNSSNTHRLQFNMPNTANTWNNIEANSILKCIITEENNCATICIYANNSGLIKHGLYGYIRVNVNFILPNNRHENIEYQQLGVQDGNFIFTKSFIVRIYNAYNNFKGLTGIYCDIDDEIGNNSSIVGTSEDSMFKLSEELTPWGGEENESLYDHNDFDCGRTDSTDYFKNDDTYPRLLDIYNVMRKLNFELVNGYNINYGTFEKVGFLISPKNNTGNNNNYSWENNFVPLRNFSYTIRNSEGEIITTINNSNKSFNQGLIFWTASTDIKYSTLYNLYNLTATVTIDSNSTLSDLRTVLNTNYGNLSNNILKWGVACAIYSSCPAEYVTELLVIKHINKDTNYPEYYAMLVFKEKFAESYYNASDKDTWLNKYGWNIDNIEELQYNSITDTVLFGNSQTVYYFIKSTLCIIGETTPYYLESSYADHYQDVSKFVKEYTSFIFSKPDYVLEELVVRCLMHKLYMSVTTYNYTMIRAPKTAKLQSITGWNVSSYHDTDDILIKDLDSMNILSTDCPWELAEYNITDNTLTHKLPTLYVENTIQLGNESDYNASPEDNLHVVEIQPSDTSLVVILSDPYLSYDKCKNKAKNLLSVTNGKVASDGTSGTIVIEPSNTTTYLQITVSYKDIMSNSMITNEYAVNTATTEVNSTVYVNSVKQNSNDSTVTLTLNDNCPDDLTSIVRYTYNCTYKKGSNNTTITITPNKNVTTFSVTFVINNDTQSQVFNVIKSTTVNEEQIPHIYVTDISVSNLANILDTKQASNFTYSDKSISDIKTYNEKIANILKKMETINPDSNSNTYNSYITKLNKLKEERDKLINDLNLYSNIVIIKFNDNNYVYGVSAGTLPILDILNGNIYNKANGYLYINAIDSSKATCISYKNKDSDINNQNDFKYFSQILYYRENTDNNEDNLEQEDNKTNINATLPETPNQNNNPDDENEYGDIPDNYIPDSNDVTPTPEPPEVSDSVEDNKTLINYQALFGTVVTKIIRYKDNNNFTNYFKFIFNNPHYVLDKNTKLKYSPIHSLYNCCIICIQPGYVIIQGGDLKSPLGKSYKSLTVGYKAYTNKLGISKTSNSISNVINYSASYIINDDQSKYNINTSISLDNNTEIYDDITIEKVLNIESTDDPTTNLTGIKECLYTAETLLKKSVE